MLKKYVKTIREYHIFWYDVKCFIKSARRKIFGPKRIMCTVNYKNRYKISPDSAVMVDCEVCKITYWASNLTSLKECVTEMSDCGYHG